MGNLISGNSAQQLCKKGWDCFKSNKFNEAENYFRQSLLVTDSADAYYGLGVLMNMLGNTDQAIAYLKKSVAINPYLGIAYGVLGDIFVAQDQGVLAIENYAQAVAADPAVDQYKHKLIQIVRTLSFKKINDNLKGVLLECLESTEVDVADLGRTWLSVLESDDVFSSVYKLARHKEYESFRAVFDRLPSYEALRDPFFLTGLGNFTVPDLSFERWLMHIRRVLLDSVTEENLLDLELREFLACAVCRYCFFTDYIFEESDAEQSQIKALHKKIDKLKENQIDLAELAILGSYLPLYRLKKARKIASLLPGGNHVSQIIKSQIENYYEQEKIKKKIFSLTPIQDSVSMAVQVQYEEFPYPRWKALYRDIRDENVEGFLRGAEADILVAGCGTGREALELAVVFPDAHILAVDLSKSSLSYAIRKATEFGIENVSFQHADIMELCTLEHRFDYIASSGVLHHLNDPVEGWRILTQLLKPKGLMRIALYSRQARAAVNEARHKIFEKGIGSDADSIRKFRRDAKQLLKFGTLKTLENFLDYYTIPECRDLLFHVQEHQFDLYQVEGILKELDLEFLKFYLPQDVLDKYLKRYSNDPHGINLQQWADWESRKQDTFAGMYRFWCRKNS